MKKASTQNIDSTPGASNDGVANSPHWVADFEALFSESPVGIAEFQLLRQDDGSDDFICLVTNAAFAASTGLTITTGCPLSEAIPDLFQANPEIFEGFLRVSQGGEPERFDVYLEGVKNWFEVCVFGAKPDHFAAIFNVITGRKREAETLKRKVMTLESVINSVPHVVFWKDRESRYLGFNRAWYDYTGNSPSEEFIGKSDFDFAWKEYAPAFREDDREVMATGVAKYHIIEPIVVDETTNEIRWLDTSKEPLRDQHGKIFGVIGQLQDITERRHDEEKLKQAAKVFEATTEGVMITDAKVKIIAVNKAFMEITGYSEEEALGRSPSLLKSSHHDAAFYDSIWETIAKQGYWRGEIWNRRKSGEVYPEWLTIDTVRDDAGQVVNYVAVFTDIGPVKEYEQRLEFLAHHDPLTGLPNRALLMDRLDRAIQRTRREGHALAVLFIDLDHFKKVNDGMGHPVGDELLEMVAQRLSLCIRGEDTVARIGGDEFVVILENIHEANNATQIAEKILETLTAPFLLRRQEVFIGASIGISTYPVDGDDPAWLLKNADAAMYRAKDRGRNMACYYSSDLTRAAQSQLQLETELRHALSQKQFLLHFQPQFEVGTNRLSGVEALVRWNHPDKGLVSPNHFIPYAEQSGLIVPLGYWVLESACRQMKRWQEQYGGKLNMAVNLSPRQFGSADLASRVGTILEVCDVDPCQIELEITEGAIMEHGEQSIAKLQSLKDLGVRIGIDDFGTGYSSLAYLCRFPIDVLKIDQSFMRDIPSDSDAKEIAATIIAMAQNLKMSVIAEGVETAEQLDFLKQQGCDFSQGFFYAPPMPGIELTQLLQLHLGPK